LVEQFSARAFALGAMVETVPSFREAQGFIARFCRKESIKSAVACPRAQTLLGESELPLLEAESLKDLAAAQMGIVAADYGIAETGTLVHFHEDDLEKLAGILPATCLALVEAKNIVSAAEDLAPVINERLCRPGIPGAQLSFVSGPSRTADIECQLCIGVHGPARLVILVVGEARK